MTTFIVVDSECVVSFHRGPVRVTIHFIGIVAIKTRCHEQNRNIDVIETTFTHETGITRCHRDQDLNAFILKARAQDVCVSLGHVGAERA